MRKKLIISLFFIVAIIGVLNFTSVRKISRNAVLAVSCNLLQSIHSVGSEVKDKFSFIGNISRLKKQNDELSDKIISLEVDRSKIEELTHENNLLKSELGYIEKDKGNTLLPARIIGRDPTTFLDHMIVDKGENDGVKKGMAVISGGVLVGQIGEVYANQSKIVLITSKDSLILAMLENSRSTGILHGGISGLVLENITQDVNNNPGENVVTSGLDGDIKSGILIGKTGKIQSSTSDLFKNIAVEPIADLSKLELVFIIKQ